MFSMRLRLRLHERTGAITHAPLYIRNGFSQSSLRRSGVVRCSTACHSSTRLSSAGPSGRTWLAAHGLHAVSPPPQPLNSDGTITNEASLDKVPTTWHSLLRVVADAYVGAVNADSAPAGASLLSSQETRQQLVGVYLRGSLPRGLFLPGISDVDTLALVLTDAPAVLSSDDDADRCSSSTMSARLVAAVQRALEPALHAHQHLDFTKVEIKVLKIARGSACGIELAARLIAAASAEHAQLPPQQQTQQQPQQAQQQQQQQQQDRPPGTMPLPAELLQCLPMAFELRTQCVTLAGLDLPALLPTAAGLPEAPHAPQLLPSLADDLDAAAVRVTRWALKRVLRAAHELAWEREGVWTRDLYWCAELAGRAVPDLQPQLAEVLAQYVSLLPQSSSAAGAAAASGAASAAVHPPEVEPAAVVAESHVESHAESHIAAPVPVDAAWRAMRALAPRLEARFTAAMLTEHPGWLKLLPSGPIPALPHPSTTTPSSTAAVEVLRTRLAALLPQRLRQPSSAAAAAAVAAVPATLLGATPPQTCVEAAAAVASAHWDQPTSRATAVAELRAALAGVVAPEDESRRPRPLLLRGAAAGWPAVTADSGNADANGGGWGLEWLAAQTGAVGRVRVAPSLQFPFCEPALAELLQELRGAAALPSVAVDMTAEEFVQRLGATCALPPLVYAPPAREHVYWQSQLDAALLQEQLPLHHLLQQLAVPLSDGREGGAADSAAPAPQFSQPPRLWVSPAGAVSPCHYDASPSFLLQLRGKKRMLLAPPGEGLVALAPYPDSHLLRRRARANLLAPLDSAPRPAQLASLSLSEALLQPGDVLFFPGGWHHHTESIGEGSPGQPAGVSMSVTWRLAAAASGSG